MTTTIETADRPGVTIRCCGYTLDNAPEHLGEFRDSTDALHDVEELRGHMAKDGYLFLPGLLDRQQVLDARREVCQRLYDKGFLKSGSDPMQGIISGTKSSNFMPEVITRGNQPLKRVLYEGAMMEFWERFFGHPIRHFDYTWFRSVFPGPATPSHCDVVYMGRGTPDLYTAWTPIGDADAQLGGLMILEGSNNHQKLRTTYCRMDVDAFCANRDGPAGLDEWQKGTDGHLSEDPNRIRRSLGGRWLYCRQFRAGDVLVFSVFTVHAGSDNQSPDRIRLSSDSRYQRADEPVDERWIGENPVAHGPGGKRALIC